MIGTEIMKRTVWVTLLFSALLVPASAQVTTLLSFEQFDGAGPLSLVQGTNGNFYGTTNSWGTMDSGTVFEMSPAGKLVTLYNFCNPAPCPFGVNAGLIQATDGKLYGTTSVGGANNYGTVFQVNLAGKLTMIYQFCSLSGCSDGKWASAGLLQAADGDIYGTTGSGGTYGYGTVFKITKTGALITIASFDGTNGMNPSGGLLQATDGNFYGTTVNNTCQSNPSCDTIFRMTPGGKLSTIYNFCSLPNCTDGWGLWGGLVQGADGNLYGTTGYGGLNNYGTIFKISGPGKLTTLHAFDFTDGATPQAGLVEGTDGNFYGTTAYGGANNFGTLFSITAQGNLTTLYNFCSQPFCTDGYGPSSLIQATNGEFYGTTFAGGIDMHCYPNGCGTVFSLSMGLGPFVELRLTAGKVGSRVIVLGNSLTGTTAVSFNGTPATFTVLSGTEIVATVPAGATTGFVTVTDASGTLTSNTPFRVIP